MPPNGTGDADQGPTRPLFVWSQDDGISSPERSKALVRVQDDVARVPQVKDLPKAPCDRRISDPPSRSRRCTFHHGSSIGSLLRDERADQFSGGAVGTRDAMRVHVQRRRRPRMAKALRHSRHNNQIAQHLRRHEMPQVMQTKMADSAPANEPDERLGDPVRCPRRSAIGIVREHERLTIHVDAAIGLARTVLAQRVDDCVVEGDVVTAMCLGSIRS